MRAPISLSLTDAVVLGLIAEEPRHGFAAARELAPDAAIGRIWSVHRPLVYRSIDHLAASDLIEPVRTEPGHQGPHRTVYRATRRGRDRHRRWLTQPVDHPRQVRAELLVKFVFLTRRGAPLRVLAQAQLDRFEPMHRGLERAARDADGADRVIALWRLETLRATRRMLRQVIEDDQSGSARTGG